MAKKQNIQNTSKNINNSFTKGLNKDSDPSFVSEGMWTHAINLVNNTIEGDIGTLSNETSNYLCATSGSTMPQSAVDKYIIGAIYLYSDKWIIFTAGHGSNGVRVSSEIGLLEEDACRYRVIVQDSCLNFDKHYLISGAAREKEDCSWQVYWADGFNPDRFLNVGDPKNWPTPDYNFVGGGSNTINFYSNGTDTNFLWPGVQWEEKCVTEDLSCEVCTNLNSLNCDKTRLARLLETPCVTVTLGQQGGTLFNGTYFALIAYTIKGQRVTDYFSQSNNQFIYTPNDTEGSLIINVEADSENFDEFVLVLVSTTNQQTVAHQFGFYSTRQSKIAIDIINNSLVKIPLEQLPIQTPVFETSDQITDVNSYLLRVGPRSRFDFNYQPLANLIRTKWASVEYPGDYYMQGGNKTTYLRDEVYTFFIRWVYETGDKSSSYHIPGRAPRDFNIPTGGTLSEIDEITDPANLNKLATDDRVFEVYNTASAWTAGPLIGTETDDGGKIIATGDMAYWESTEEYPDNRSDIWNSSTYCWTSKYGQPSTDYDLCGLPIRHHKFPENFINNNNTKNVVHFRAVSGGINNDISEEYYIRILGVFFENIVLPKDQDGNDIPGIAGYEILRGSREGNKSIIAKGMVNNFRTYKIPGNPANYKEGLYANYPFNTVIPIGSSTDPNDHNFQYNDPYIKNTDSNNDVENQRMPIEIFSFHSPDTMFRSPYLNQTEFKLYGTLSGYADQKFQFPIDHPKWKLLSDNSMFPMIIAGVAGGVISMLGKRTNYSPDLKSPVQAIQLGSVTGNLPQMTALGVLGAQSPEGPGGVPPAAPVGPLAVWNEFARNYYGWTSFADVFTAIATGYDNTLLSTAESTLYSAINNSAAATGILAYNTYSIELPDWAYLDPLSRTLGALNQLTFYFAEAADVTLQLIYAIVPFRKYALQQMSYGFYSDMFKYPTNVPERLSIKQSFYLRDNVQGVPKYQDPFTGIYKNFLINNLKRSDTIIVRTTTGPRPGYPEGILAGPSLITAPSIKDNSLNTLGTVVQNPSPFVITDELPSFKEDEVDTSYRTKIASHYGALKLRLRNQYGQLGSTYQLAITPCEQKLKDTNVVTVGPIQCSQDNESYKFNVIPRTSVFFGGDTYINRYTEKNNMMFFNNWLFDQPDGFEYNYYLYNMIPSPRFRVNSIKYDVTNLGNFSTGIPGVGFRPSASYDLDFYETGCSGIGVGGPRFYNYATDNRNGCFQLLPFPWVDYYAGTWGVKNAYFYLASSSIKDFFVESDVLVDFRRQSERGIGGKHYDPYRYTDYEAMFDMNPSIMGQLSEYLYDYSLSVSKLYNQYFSAGSVQTKYYDPEVASLCYTYYPDRIIYSLPQQDEAIKDSWFIYLINNYKEFKGQISGVKSINKSGIFITFKNESPLMFQGVDTLETDLNTKITIGDGGLFSQPQQSINTADTSYEFGSSQNRLSVISTPAGIYYMSQNQGRIFSYGQGLQEISQAGMKWWFILYMPYKLLEDFPEYPWKDNPVIGIGCQSTYDSSNSVLYFTKKDYYLKDAFKNQVTYVPLDKKGIGDYFILNGNQNSIYKLGDPFLFEDASWTMSYDPKAKFWISFHDWHPDLLIPTKDRFLSTKTNTVWQHNNVCNSFCNFYNQQYGWEIEFPVLSGQQVMTTRSMEYILECYRRKSGNCVDQHHVLDYNFDKAVVYNTEQVSGYLNLNLYPKNNINLSLQYPKLNTNLSSYDILYSKEEQKYRFNQFWDITKDRAEFPQGFDYPPTGPIIPGTTVLQGNYSSENTWITAKDGHTRILNPNNMDYTKAETQRKKFRHYLNFLNLRKEQCDDVNMILKFSTSKNKFSIR